jgi:hypothetical protein
MTAKARPRQPVPQRHWRSYGSDPPSGAEALDQPFAAFPSWFMQVTCDRCGQQRMFSETHAAEQRDMLIHDIRGASSRPARRPGVKASHFC